MLTAAFFTWAEHWNRDPRPFVWKATADNIIAKVRRGRDTPARRPPAAHRADLTSYVIYQKVIAAYADSNRRRGKRVLAAVIDSIRRGVPAGLEEIVQLGRTLWL